jgi:branched-chain amino acid transport system permease protein
MEISFSTIVALLVGGLVTASTLFIVSSGLSLIFGVSRIVNFAHGSLYMLGAYVAYSILGSLPRTLLGFCLGLLISVAIVGAVGFLIETIVLRRLYKAPQLLQLLATYGVVLIVQDAVRYLWGPQDLVDVWAPGISQAVVIFGNYIPAYNLAIIVVGPVLFVALWYAINNTRWGVLLRAATHDREMLGALGVNQRWLFTSVFVLGAALAAFGGVLIVPRGGASTQMDLSVIVEAFVVVVIGGLGSLSGAFAASLLIGVLQSFSLLFFPKLTLVFIFLIMAVVLFLRPQGLAGRRDVAGRELDNSVASARATLSTSTSAILQCAIIGVAALVPVVSHEYLLIVTVELLIFMVFASSLYLLIGTAGIMTFGHAAFFGIGAYTVALLIKFFHLQMVPALLAAPICAALAAAVFGWFCIRLDGVYRAMLTLAFAQIVWSIAFQWYDITGGDNGITGVRPAPWASQMDAFFYLVLAVCAVTIAFLTWVASSPLGFGLRGARDSSLRATAIGINVRRTQWIAFSLAGAAAGLAGALYAYSRGSVFPDMISIDTSVEGLVMVILGGLTSWVGPLIGAVVYHGALTEIIRFTDYWRSAIGILILVISISMPEGIIGLAGYAVTRREARR